MRVQSEMVVEGYKVGITKLCRWGALKIPCQSDTIISRIDNGRKDRYRF